MKVRVLLVLFCLLGLVGCFTPSDRRYVDLPHHEGIPIINKITIEGNILHISIVQDGNGVYVAGIEPRLIDGDIYLIPICISSVVHETEFSVDLSDKHFPKDWKNRIYWIEGDSISSPVNPFIHHYREIQRSKIVIQ